MIHFGSFIYSAHVRGEATTLSTRFAGLCAVLQSLSTANGGRGWPLAPVWKDLRFRGQQAAFNCGWSDQWKRLSLKYLQSKPETHDGLNR